MARPYTWAVLRMSTGFFFLFMAFNTAQNLESTVVSDTQLVNASLALLYGVFTVMTIFAPKLVNMMGPRLAMALGAVPYVLLVFANIKPCWELFMPAFAGVGMGAALLWTAQGISLSRCAIHEASMTGESMDLVTSRFNGMFWTTFQFNGAVGLSIGATIIILVSDYSKALTYLFLGFGIVGAIGNAILFTVPVPPSGGAGAHQSLNAATSPLVSAASIEDLVDEEDHANSGHAGSSAYARRKAATAKSNGDSSLVIGDQTPAAAAEASEVSLYETVRLFCKSRRMQLLIPIIFYTGASLGYNSAMFPLTYQDRDGDQNLIPGKYVGYVSATFFLVNSACSYLWGRLIPVIGRRPLFVTTLISHIAYYAMVYIFLKRDTGLEHNSIGAFCLIFATSSIFAIGDSVLESQLPALIQSPSFFPSERDRDAANSNVRLWQSLGFTAQFVVGIIAPSNVLVQTYFVAPMLIAAMLSLAILHYCVQSVEPAKETQYQAISPAGVDGHADGETVHTLT